MPVILGPRQPSRRPSRRPIATADTIVRPTVLGCCILIPRPDVASPVRHVLDVDRVGILTDGVADSMERWNERLDLVFEHVEESEAEKRRAAFDSPTAFDGVLLEFTDYAHPMDRE